MEGGIIENTFQATAKSLANETPNKVTLPDERDVTLNRLTKLGSDLLNPLETNHVAHLRPPNAFRFRDPEVTMGDHDASILLRKT